MLEKGLAVGGHWAWDTNYPGVGVQNHPGAYRFSGKAMATKGTRATAAEVQRYLEEYAHEHALHQHIRLGNQVLQITDDGQ